MTNKLFNKIKKEAEPMQDLREDSGHAEVVKHFAEKLCNMLKADEEIVIPAAILHDIGYYGVSKEKLGQLMAGKLSAEETKFTKDLHMKNGAKFAEEIMGKLKYDSDTTKKITCIILSHDLNTPPQSIEEKIVRDADKLWRFSKKGFSTDINRRQCEWTYWHNYLLGNINKPNYFLTEEARKIAIKELKMRKKEYEAKKN